MKWIRAALLIVVGAVLVSVFAAGAGVAAGAADDALTDAGPAPDAPRIRVADTGDSEADRIRRLNAAFTGEFERRIARFRDACAENTPLDRRLATVEAGIHGLFALVGRYEQKAYELSTRNHILLLTIEELLDHGMVFTGWGRSLADLVRTEDLSDNFVSYYKSMHNLGDSVEARDFREAWARDMAQGLACLDR